MADRNEERKMEGIALIATTPDKVRTIDEIHVVSLGFREGTALYQVSTLDSSKTPEELRSTLGDSYFSKMLKAGMDNAGTSYVSRGALPRRVEVWPSEGMPSVQLRSYQQGYGEPENWDIALDLI